MTADFSLYLHESAPVAVYDSPGITLADEDSYLKKLQLFIERLESSSNDYTRYIHVVWFVIDASSSRFHGYYTQVNK